MEQYSVEYWLAHFEYAMGHKEMIDIDTSNENWTRNNIERILNNEFPHGMTGTNGAMALIQYIDNYYPNKKNEVVKLMTEYIKSIRTPNRPLNMVYNYYSSLINNNGEKE